MNRVDQARQATKEALGLTGESNLDYITAELIDEYASFPAGDGNILVRRSDGSPAPETDVAEVIEGTATYYGNHPMRLGSCLYWKTNGVGQPCGSGFTARACNWKSAQQTLISSCSGGYAGYRFTFTY